MSQTLLFATRNAGKLVELRQLLALNHVELLSLADRPDVPELPETGSSFATNAAQKAGAAMRATGLASLADDSGLEIDALGGAPGVHSARYAGPEASDQQRYELVLSQLVGVPADRRTARFRCAVAFVSPREPDRVVIREGRFEGVIGSRPAGSGGFGYDPIFYLPELGCTFAELAPEEKNAISHRGEAIRQMAEFLRRYFASVL
jgi:XTP/dITP diphosphohydrolase